MVTRPPPGTIPNGPGSYQFRDRDGRFIYVGKAKSLRSRISSYFGTQVAPRTKQMVETATSIEWIEVRNEVEALFLEYNLIKEHRPRFNIDLMDDKSYPYLAVTLSEEWPSAMVTRDKRRKGSRYFGPYAHAYAIRETLDLLLRTFPIRTCTNAKFKRHQRMGRPCLYAHIEKCAAPCVASVDAEAYGSLVGDLVSFLDGETAPVLDRLTKEMHDASESLDFERAARLRDQVLSVRKIVERQQMVGDESEDLDVIGIAQDELEASVQVFYVRRGRVIGRKGFVVDKVEPLTPPAFISRILEQLYGDASASDMPGEVLVPQQPDDRELYEEFLSMVRSTGKVRIRLARGSDRRDLLATVTRNAEDAFAQHRLRRSSDHNARAKALTALQKALGLIDAPLRIECFDISNLQGSEIVASMTVLEDGLAKPSDYRRFKIRHQEGQDDFAAMEEALTRRFHRYLEERDEGARDGRRFAYPPNLLVVDGGKGQLNVAVRVLEEFGLEEIAVVGLAKRFEEVFKPGISEPIRIPRDSEALYLLQRVRDEAHRFAIAYHRQLRKKNLTLSVLDEVPGLGPARRTRLLKEYRSVKQIREKTEAELVALPWLPDTVARALYMRLHGGSLPDATLVGSADSSGNGMLRETEAFGEELKPWQHDQA